jgi:hypothetical protein
VDKTAPTRLLQEHQLFLKRSKCALDMREVAYFNHAILEAGFAMDQQKVHAVLEWLVLSLVWVVCTFIGLVGYYRRFIKDYGSIVEPLTHLLHKVGFRWCTEVEAAFCALQLVLTMMPVLQLLIFDKSFIIECDTLSTGFREILHQGEGALAFFSKQIAPRHAKLIAYTQELIGLVQDVCH